MKVTAYLLCGAALCAAAAPAFAASPWDGTWKLNQSKSQMTGSTVTISQSGPTYTVDTGAVKFSFACDGKQYPVVPGATTSCQMKGSDWVTTNYANGHQTSTTTHMLSADGQTETATTTGSRPDGTPFKNVSTSKRLGAGKGIAGTWKEVKEQNTQPGLVQMKVENDALSYDVPAYKETSTAKLDGTPAPVMGPNVPPNLMVSNKWDGKDKIKTVATLNGKEMGTDIMTISPDGKTITDVSWTVGKENEKQTYVYEKQ